MGPGVSSATMKTVSRSEPAESGVRPVSSPEVHETVAIKSAVWTAVENDLVIAGFGVSRRRSAGGMHRRLVGRVAEGTSRNDNLLARQSLDQSTPSPCGRGADGKYPGSSRTHPPDDPNRADERNVRMNGVALPMNRRLLVRSEDSRIRRVRTPCGRGAQNAPANGDRASISRCPTSRGADVWRRSVISSQDSPYIQQTRLSVHPTKKSGHLQ
jgi:hypothetical protein